MAEQERMVSAEAGESQTIDGRRLRRERNIAAAVGAVVEMFEEEALTPTIERAAERSGLSLRSVYRYFPDPESLTQAAIDELWRRGRPVSHLSDIGEGPFESRVADFSAMRVRLYEQIGSGYRAGRLQAPKSAQIREDLDRTRRALTDQFELQFRQELDALRPEIRMQRRHAADVMSQLDAIDLLRRARRLTVQETIDVVADAIRVALTA